MSEIPPTPPTGEDHTGPGGDGGRPRQLLRSSRDRILGGVAGGLAEYFKVDPVLIRIAFAITGLMGIGLIAYLALYVFVPEDDGWGNPVPARDRDRMIAGGAIIFLLFLAVPGGLFPLTSIDWWWGVSAALFWIAVLAGIGYALYWLISGKSKGPPDGAGRPHAAAANQGATPGPGGRAASSGGSTSGGGATSAGVAATGGTGPQERSLGHVMLMIALFAALAIFSLFLATTSAWGAAVGGTAVVAVAVILAGIMIGAAAFVRPMRWLIVPALALALPAAAVAAADYQLEGGYGDRVIRPARLADIPDDGYRMAAGNMVIDLRQADWRHGSEVELPAKLNFGRISVVVPENVCVASDVEVWAGGFEILGESDSDFRVDYRRTLPETAAPKLHLKGNVDIGWVEVLTRMPAEDWEDFHPGLREPNATQPAHCLEEQQEGSASQKGSPIDTRDGNRNEQRKRAKARAER